MNRIVIPLALELTIAIGLLAVLLYPVQLFVRVIRDFQPPTNE